jgi:IS30 family transposase
MSYNSGMKKYTHLTKEERFLVEFLRSIEITQKSIAELLGRDPGTISREIKKHRKKKSGEYDAKYASLQAESARRNASHKGRIIEENEDLKIYIIKGLILDWSPDVIAGRMKKEGKPFYASKTAIYDWLYSAWGQLYCGLLPSQSYRKKKRKAKKTKREMIPNRIGLDARPAEFKAEFGHYETDTIVSGKKTGGKAAIVSVIDPKSKYVGLHKISSLSPVSNEAAIQSILEQFSNPKSLTRDNGIENKNHQQTLIPSYFCRAYHSWEKPHVENENKLTRFYIPKGTNIDDVSEDELAGTEWLLNQKPRKSLDYRSPYEVMIENGQLKNLSQKVSQYALNRIVSNCSLVALHG